MKTHTITLQFRIRADASSAPSRLYTSCTKIWSQMRRGCSCTLSVFFLSRPSQHRSLFQASPATCYLLLRRPSPSSTLPCSRASFSTVSRHGILSLATQGHTSHVSRCSGLHTRFGKAWSISIAQQIWAVQSAMTTSIIAYCLSPWHPLARYPGPIIARISMIWTASTIVNGKAHTYRKELHDKYGPCVRTGKCRLLRMIIEAVF